MRMDIYEHKQKFEEVVKKYNLSSEEKSQEIAHYITKNKRVSVKEFATLFAMNQKEAQVFLSFVEKGLKFKEKYVDKE